MTAIAWFFLGAGVLVFAMMMLGLVLGVALMVHYTRGRP